MVRKRTEQGARLQALLDERDHLRVQISLADDERGEEVVILRRRILELDRAITKHWDDATP